MRVSNGNSTRKVFVEIKASWSSQPITRVIILMLVEVYMPGIDKTGRSDNGGLTSIWDRIRVTGSAKGRAFFTHVKTLSS